LAKSKGDVKRLETIRRELDFLRRQLDAQTGRVRKTAEPRGVAAKSRRQRSRTPKKK
jgi:hypothetical protein